MIYQPGICHEYIRFTWLYLYFSVGVNNDLFTYPATPSPLSGEPTTNKTKQKSGSKGSSVSPTKVKKIWWFGRRCQSRRPQLHPQLCRQPHDVAAVSEFSSSAVRMSRYARRDCWPQLRLNPLWFVMERLPFDCLKLVNRRKNWGAASERLPFDCLKLVNRVEMRRRNPRWAQAGKTTCVGDHDQPSEQYEARRRDGYKAFLVLAIAEAGQGSTGRPRTPRPGHPFPPQAAIWLSKTAAWRTTTRFVHLFGSSAATLVKPFNPHMRSSATV